MCPHECLHESDWILLQMRNPRSSPLQNPKRFDGVPHRLAVAQGDSVEPTWAQLRGTISFGSPKCRNCRGILGVFLTRMTCGLWGGGRHVSAVVCTMRRYRKTTWLSIGGDCHSSTASTGSRLERRHLFMLNAFKLQGPHPNAQISHPNCGTQQLTLAWQNSVQTPYQRLRRAT